MFYAAIAHSSSVNGTVALSGTNSVRVGPCVARLEDTPGSGTYADDWLLLDLAGFSAAAGSVLTNVIADPGDAGAIPVTSSGYVPIVTAGSETRTLAAPTFIGQEITLMIDTDGGVAVVTTASPVNQTGNNTLTMTEINDSIRLHAVTSTGSALVWRVVCNDGVALTTVP